MYAVAVMDPEILHGIAAALDLGDEEDALEARVACSCSSRASARARVAAHARARARAHAQVLAHAHTPAQTSHASAVTHSRQPQELAGQVCRSVRGCVCVRER